jgi:hypothetical protein
MAVSIDRSERPSAWKKQSYEVPNPGRRAFRWKASALRTFQHWSARPRRPRPALIVVPALFSLLPAETFAMGWLNEIDALRAIRKRIVAAAKKTGWDVYTFHTQHNLDSYYDTNILAVRDTLSHEGSLPTSVVAETKRRFGSLFAYHWIEPRLIENLVFQSSLMECVAARAEETPIQFHAVGTAVYSALIRAGALTFDAAVDSLLRVGARWDKAVAAMSGGERERFEIVQRVLDGRERMSVTVTRADLPKVEAPSQPFWFSTAANEEPVLVETAREAALALESLNLASWSTRGAVLPDHPVRGFLNSPLHPYARHCRWTVSNYLLSTPSAVTLFMEHIAGIPRAPHTGADSDAQKRLRLSRMKVTGP